MDDQTKKNRVIKYPCIKMLAVILIAGQSLACKQPKSENIKDSQLTTVVKLPVNDQVIIYIDSIASKFDNQKFNAEQLKLLTDSFSSYFPVGIYKDDHSVPDSSIAADINISSAVDQYDFVNLSIPENIGTKLSFKQLTAHFGPVTPRDTMFPAPKMPFPLIIELKNHFPNQKSHVFLNIQASDSPESITNQISSIKIVRSK
ncbi:hypothetical protein AY601_2967 [Pedobacter cryoconitis]|uniref:Lipoprotein n=1 Tax=Pedobacter cryoconitis TaxID=188932 RepID=A0A127VF54_9SPHI|nr:hypothetical protein [Pedobacter cryoconitis]AMP99841.1 hypothetical protein AY601_2967 [Pedobacter cryoconitis]